MTDSELQQRIRELEQQLAASQTALTESEARYRRLARQFPNGAVYFFDTDLRLTLGEGAILPVLGGASGNYDGKTLQEALPAEAVRLLEPCCRAALHGSSKTAEIYFKGYDFIVYVSPLTADDGTISGGIIVSQDITELKRTDEALRNSEAKYRALFEEAVDAILLLDPVSTALVEFNKRAHNALGYSRSEFQKFHLSDIECREPGRQIRKRISAILHNGFGSYETQHQSRDGRVCDVLVNARVVEISGSTCIQLMCRDITDRKRVERERVMLSTAVEQAAETVVIMGADGVIQYINPAIGRILGYSREQAIGLNPFITPRGVYGSDFYQRIWEYISGGHIWKGHLTNRKSDGSECEMEAAITPIRDDAGSIIGFVSIARDVTNVLRLEQQLRQSEKMKAIGTLAGGIAHDFNNILGAIIGFTEMAQYELHNSDRVAYNLDQVLRSSMRAKDLVRQILAFSRGSETERRPLSVHPIVSEVMRLLRASIPSTIEIRTRIDKQAGMILADPTQIHQVLMNLGTNAAHAMREQGGMLEVSLDSILIDTSNASGYHDLPQGHYVRLTVADIGIGIPGEIIHNIFEPFFTTKSVGEGTGMGLAVVHGIVSSFGGTITVNSMPGEGSVFSVLFPKVDIAPGPAVEAEVPLPTGSERILFVDDEELIIDVGTRMLMSLGYAVEARQSSPEALELFRKDPERFDLIMTDQTMPKITGFELARQVLDQRPDMPVILCTGFSESVNVQKALQRGIADFIMKPFQRSQLADSIRNALDKRKKS